MESLSQQSLSLRTEENTLFLVSTSEIFSVVMIDLTTFRSFNSVIDIVDFYQSNPLVVSKVDLTYLRSYIGTRSHTLLPVPKLS